MAGGLNARPYRWFLTGLAALVMLCSAARAQRESSEPIGGVQFDPPRQASIRHKSGQLIRGELIGISPELVHFRVKSGKEFQYDFKDIRSIATNDGEFKYASAYDTFRELVENAQGLSGVTIDAVASVAGTGAAPPLPRPPAPTLPMTVEEPVILALNQDSQSTDTGPAAIQVPAIPADQPQQQPTVAGGVGAQPFYETNAFRVSFLAGCLAIIVFWWRNRVG